MISIYNLIKKLTKYQGVSGHEKPISDAIRDEMLPLVDEICNDALGNLIAVKKSKSNSPHKIMLAAHMDEIGFMVTFIEDNGFIRFHTIGGINLYAAAFSTVVFENGISGVIIPESGTPAADYRADKFYVDIGSKDKKDSERKVKIGDTFALESNITKLSGKRIAGRPLDDRIGCALMIAVANMLVESTGGTGVIGADDSGDSGGVGTGGACDVGDSASDDQNATLKNDVYFVFTTQEEVGLRGAKPAAQSILPDVAIAFDVTATGDSQGSKPMAIKLGGGAAVKIKDSSVICNIGLVEKMKAIAEKNKIAYQLEILESGGTDTSSMQSAGAGCIAGAISIPTRYIHSSVEMIDIGDVEQCVNLTVALLQDDNIIDQA